MDDVPDDGLWYPSVDDILLVHEDIVGEDENTEQGVESEDRIQFAVDYVQHGHFDKVPETLHEKAFHLMRLIASNHWFVDGNKRTALNSTELFYMVNGYELNYGEDIRSMLKLFSVRERLIDREAGAEYLKDQVTHVEIEEEDTDTQAALVVLVVAELANQLNVGPEAYPSESSEMEFVREEWGLTTFEEDGTVNNDDDQE